MRHKKVDKRQIQPDFMYNSILVAKFTNCLMKNGKKTAAQRAIYQAFDLIKEKGMDPLEVFEKALQTIGPKIEVKARRVGGASYQVPVEVRNERKVALAIRWILDAARKRPNTEYHTFGQKLAQELMDASQNQGEAIRKRDVMQKQADANKAFASFRW
ncbi:MAG TPA: 30S ribosomal protein S7 [Patescibacteria group bacterium]|nr:30S ribosomal protein S7 [Patescibacteria group bacterium]